MAVKRPNLRGESDWPDGVVGALLASSRLKPLPQDLTCLEACTVPVGAALAAKRPAQAADQLRSSAFTRSWKASRLESLRPMRILCASSTLERTTSSF